MSRTYAKWNLNAPHRTNLANITGWYSCIQNSRNYISDVTFNYFYSDSRKVPRIKADELTPVNSTPYDSWCTRFDFCGPQYSALHRGGKPRTKIQIIYFPILEACTHNLRLAPAESTIAQALNAAQVRSQKARDFQLFWFMLIRCTHVFICSCSRLLY